MEFKTGDIVEVKESNKSAWCERIFLFEKDSMFYCISNRQEGLYRDNLIFECVPWNECRKKPEKKYRPFTWEERDQLRGKWIKEKEQSQDECMIIGLIYKDEAWIDAGELGYFTPEYLLENYIFLDGSSCGVEVK
jgi:hypothetical protein